MLIVPSVTMNGCIRSPTTSMPLISPHASPIPSGTATASGSTFQALAFSGKFCSTAAVPSAAKPKIEPTEMSIPPAMITNVTPTAMIAIQLMGVKHIGQQVVRPKKLVDALPLKLEPSPAAASAPSPAA